MKSLPPTSSSPAIAVEEEADLHRELPRPHRTLAFEGVAAEVAVGCSPLTGDTSRPLQPPDPRSPSMAAAAEVKPSPIRPPNLHKTHSLPSEEETKELTSDTVPRSKNDHSIRAGDEEQTRRIPLPKSARQKVHQLPASNRNDAERTEKEQEPPYSPHHRLPRDNDGAQKTGPRTTRTIYTTAQQNRGPPLFRQAKRPPESKGTTGLAGGDARSPRFRLQSPFSGKVEEGEGGEQSSNEVYLEEENRFLGSCNN